MYQQGARALPVGERGREGNGENGGGEGEGRE